MLGAGHARTPRRPIAILVLVQLEGGNDGLNTLIPIDDAPGVSQRSLYASARPSIGIAVADLLDTEIDADPVKGNRLALHPSLAPLHDLYAAGNVAVVTGVALPEPEPVALPLRGHLDERQPDRRPFIDGWFGRYLDSAYTPSDLVTVDLDKTLSPAFFSAHSNVLAVNSLAEFELSDDPLYPDLAAKQAALAGGVRGRGRPARDQRHAARGRHVGQRAAGLARRLRGDRHHLAVEPERQARTLREAPEGRGVDPAQRRR